MKRRRYTVYRNGQPFASTEASCYYEAIANVAGRWTVAKIDGTKSRFFLLDDLSVLFTVIRLNTDEDDCAAWMMTKYRDVRFVDAKHMAGSPEFVLDTINIGGLATMEDGRMYSTSLEQLFGA